MLSLLLTPAALSLSLLACPPGGEQKKDEVGPPGTIALAGGRTKVGNDKKEIQRLIDEVPGATGAVRALDAETPQSTMDLSAFFLGVTEMTNEQYAAFVTATGHRPPEGWGKAAIDAGRQAFAEEMGRKRQEAIAAGKNPGERQTFDAGAWWKAHWQESEWAVPKGEELKPVVYIDYADVLAYCRWAGVRPMTEFEFQHACRGTKSDRAFPWGDEWEDAKYCATVEDRAHLETRPVGTFEAGRSEEGVYELLGNVWEWTSSPYLKYDDFKKNTYKIDGKKEVTTEPTWDGNQRVVVGGCYQNSRLVARCTVRRPTDRTQTTDSLGFRIAGSSRLGIDIADSVYSSEVRASSYRPSGVDFNTAGPATMDRWTSEPGSDGAPDGYAVITGYEYLTFVPITTTGDVTQDVDLQRLTLSEPQCLGFLSTTFGMQEPAITPGTYLVKYRAAGGTRVAANEGEEAKEVHRRDDPWAEVIDIEKPNLLFYDPASGELVHHVPIAEELRYGKGAPGGKISRFDKMITVPDPKNDKKTIQVPEPWLRVDFRIECKLRDVGLAFPFEFKPEAGVLEKVWRM